MFSGRLGSYRGKEMFDQAKKTAKIPLKLLNELLVTMKKAVYVPQGITTPIMNI